MPAPAKFGARRPCDGRTGSLRIRMLSRRSPPAAETTPRGVLGDRPDRRPAYALQTLDQDATAPAVRAPPHAHVDTDDDLLSVRMPRCTPVEDRGPVTKFHERWAPPRPAARRQAHDSVRRARSSPGARPAWTGLQGLRPTAPKDTAHAGIRGGRPRGRGHRPQGHGACRLSTTVPIESARCIDSQM